METNNIITNSQIKAGNEERDKTTSLLLLTLILGVVSIVSLFFLLRVKNKMTGSEIIMDTPKEEIPAEQVLDKNIDEILEDDELGSKKLIFELEKTDFDKMEKNYTDSPIETNKEN